MSNLIEVTHKASSRAGLSLADMNQFVQECEKSGIDPRSTLKVTVGWKQQLLSVAAQTVQLTDTPGGEAA